MDALILVLMIAATVSMIYLPLRYVHLKDKERKTPMFCTACEYTGLMPNPHRPGWTWFIVGPFALLWPKKRTCPQCKGREGIIPAMSAKAMRMAAGAS
jgi:hypothetical protein